MLGCCTSRNLALSLPLPLALPAAALDGNLAGTLLGDPDNALACGCQCLYLNAPGPALGEGLLGANSLAKQLCGPP